MAALCVTLVACGDAPTTQPHIADEPTTAELMHAGAHGALPPKPSSNDAQRVALHDAIERLLPAISHAGLPSDVGAQLQHALAAIDRSDTVGSRRALRNVERALDQSARHADAALRPELDAIRLAVQTTGER